VHNAGSRSGQDPVAILAGMQKISPFLYFCDNAVEAITFLQLDRIDIGNLEEAYREG
jgi:hypothetical protein